MTWAQLILQSNNAKTGPIPVSTTASDSCPPTCGWYDECYGKSGPISLNWQAVDSGKRGWPWTAFCARVRGLYYDQLWRHNQVGDLPRNGANIDGRKLQQLVRANRYKRGFTYTHHVLNKHNVKWIEYANANGFTINVSCDSLKEVDAAAKITTAPLVVVLPSDTTAKMLRTPEGRKVVVCHAPKNGVTCATCAICQNRSPNRAVIGFPAHGAKKRIINLKLEKT